MMNRSTGKARLAGPTVYRAPAMQVARAVWSPQDTDAVPLALLSTRGAPLPPLLSAEAARLIGACGDQITDLASRAGSPLHIIFPEAFVANVGVMQHVLQHHRVDYQLFYGVKVNKSPALVQAAVDAGIGADVASLPELQDALSAGMTGERLCATGPAKPADFHRALACSDALICVDSVEELAALEAVSDRRIRILLRLRPSFSSGSRFGIRAEQMQPCLERLACQRTRIVLEGFHFHLAGYDPAARAKGIRELVPWVHQARLMGLSPTMINIGGGLPVRYVPCPAWNAFRVAQCADVYRTHRVPTHFYPYGAVQTASDWLDTLLRMPCGEDGSVAGYLRSAGLRLAIEPGRSLVDQCALTVLRIAQAKALSAEQGVLFVEGSSFNACETWFGSEFLVDPIWMACASGLKLTAPGGMKVGAGMTGRLGQSGAAKAGRAWWVAGHGCLDEDVISHRLLRGPGDPVAGDLLIYANTAGYQMDLLESALHRHPLPRRLVARGMEKARFEFTTDTPDPVAASEPDDLQGGAK